MAIKVQSQGQIPAVDLEYLQFDQVRISIGSEPPYKIALSAQCRLYGVDSNGRHHYDPKVKSISIGDISVYISNLPDADKLPAMLAMKGIQEGLGVLAEKYFGIDFVEYT